MKKILLALTSSLLAAAASFASAQSIPRSEVSLGYTTVHSNAPAGDCGCFYWQGGSASVALGVAPHWSLAGSFDGFFANNQGTSGLSPRMVTYLIGTRYDFLADTHRLVPFAKVLAGGAYANNGYFVPADRASAVTLKLGGGVDLSVSDHWAVRPIEVDYLWTHFNNAVNNRQNNLQLTTGIVYRFHKH